MGVNEDTLARLEAMKSKTPVASTMDIMEAEVGARVQVDPWMALIVAQRHEGYLGRQMPEVVLTQDGGIYAGGWHTPEDGPPSDEWVYVERYTYGGRVFHGYVHPVSRKLTQTG